ncbi:TSC22 domain family protein 2 TSC22-related-inducible leucine zipper protein 4 [Triplophysa tibetana]|uniref:TSC22 domain family protein 2 TSC22-related-inducible leucine zipper protein 4 n=1 Tax=Triplophysa tibetana TaxID=1572043 RepID=A0A5A9PA45_9TELE|nr:TSC22 domain family protein 2 TSC22-related-inducible leucine zipper protein 4 [Triplophysa tibetana]
MSKMPAKKKSCFQITSVTQAQVGANSATDDTESLDDPDESRTEDVSSEIFDMSRTDYEPEVCDRSSSEETLNNVCETEGQLPAVAPLNGGLGVRNALSVGHQGAGGAPAIGVQQSSTSQPPQVSNSSSSTTIASCTSRFRVIKLDHGSGEPFKRGRWTCTEYYEKDQEGSVTSRTVDSMRQANVTEMGADRDSGLGATIGSIMAQVGVSGQGPDASYEGSPFTSPLYSLEAHSFSIASQQITASGSPESFNKSVPTSVQQQVQGGSHVAVPQSVQQPVHNGSQIQNSPSMPPPQVQSLLYQSQQQLPTSQHLQTQPGLISVNQPDYRQQQTGSSLPVGHIINQGASPVQTQATGGMQVLGLEMSGVLLANQSLSSVPNLLQHPGMGLLSSIAPMPPGNSVQQQQYLATGVIHGLPVAPQSNHSMPTIPVTISSMPAPAGPTLPNLLSQIPRNGTAMGMSTPGMPSSSLGQADESRRLSDASAQIPAVQYKDVMKRSITESLQLPNPAVNSLFGISIPIDGDDDSASGGSMVAIDNKIEQAMDLVKSHLMYAVREEVEVLREQIKELYERNSVLERENAVLKSLANNEQLSQLTVQSSSNPINTPSQLGPNPAQPPPPLNQPQPYLQLDVNQTLDSLPRQPQPNVTSA